MISTERSVPKDPARYEQPLAADQALDQQLSPFEELPEDIHFLLSNAYLSETDLITLLKVSKRIYKLIKNFIEYSWIQYHRAYNELTSCIPRLLTEDEKTYSKLRQIKIIKELFNEKNQRGSTPLIRATIESKINPKALKQLECLLRFGADPNQAGKGGLTPIHYAGYWGCAEAAKILKESGANTNLRTELAKKLAADYARDHQDAKTLRHII